MCCVLSGWHPYKSARHNFPDSGCTRTQTASSQSHNDALWCLLCGIWHMTLCSPVNKNNKAKKRKDFSKRWLKTRFLSPLFHSLYSRFISLCVYPSTSSFYILFWISPSFVSPFFLMPFSISRCTPTCSEVDCYTRRIAPYTLTPCCKSFIESVEVFLKEARIISEFGPAWASGQRYSFCCCSAAALCCGRIEGRRLAGRRD